MGELDAVLYFISTQPSKIRVKIEELSIVNCGLTDEDCDTIASHLESLHGLYRLSLKCNDISSAGAERICVALMVIESPIESIRFDHNCIDGQRVKRMAQIYKHCPLLTDLSFAYNPITDVGLYYLLQAIMNPNRRAYSCLPIPPALIASLTTVDVEHGNLDEIEDIDTDEDSETKEAVGSDAQMKSNSFKLARRISMQQKRVATSKKTSKICIAMRYKIEAKWLELGIIGLGGGSLMEGADINMSKSRITRIFRRCVMKLKALGLFLRLPSRGRDAYSLDVDGCRLSPSAGAMLLTAVRDNTYICELHLSDNSLGDNGAHSLCQLIRDPFVNLVLVEVRNNGLSETAAKHLTQAATSSAHLHTLDLSGNILEATAVNWVAAATGPYFVDELSLSSMQREDRDRHAEAATRERISLNNFGNPPPQSDSGAHAASRRASQPYDQNI